jgi:formylglycine-generating enzyme required for sulfatase activity
MGSPSGTGDDDEHPQHSVTISKAFYLCDHEVTQGEWQAIMGTTVSSIASANGWNTNGVGADYPMYYVSWSDAIEYCNRLSQKEGLTPYYSGSGDAIRCNFAATGYRLPTEAEWEWAAKGGGKDLMMYIYSGSNNLDSVGWYDDNTGNTTHQVKTKTANSLGLYDMSGNVWEWCWDWYGAYPSGSITDPTGAASGSYRVIRGGCWSYDASDCRSVFRGGDGPSFRSCGLGFRVCRSF